MFIPDFFFSSIHLGSVFSFTGFYIHGQNSWSVESQENSSDKAPCRLDQSLQVHQSRFFPVE